MGTVPIGVLVVLGFVGLVLIVLNLGKTFKLYQFLLGIVIFSLCGWLLYFYVRDFKQEEKIKIGTSELIEKGGILYWNDKEVYLEQESVPPIFIIRCRETLVIKKKFGNYYLDINDNL